MLRLSDPESLPGSFGNGLPCLGCAGFVAFSRLPGFGLVLSRGTGVRSLLEFSLCCGHPGGSISFHAVGRMLVLSISVSN